MLMKINNVEFVHDVDQSEALEKAIDELGEGEKKVMAAADTQKLSATNKAIISMIQTFFVTATGKDVILDCRNAKNATDFYDQFLAEVGKQKDDLVLKYSAKRVR